MEQHRSLSMGAFTSLSRGGGGGGGGGVRLNNGISHAHPTPSLHPSHTHTHSHVHSTPSGMHALFEGKMTDMHITQGYTVCK